MTKKRVRIYVAYKYNAQKRGKYCRLSPVQKYNLALAIDRYMKNGLSSSLIKKNIFELMGCAKFDKLGDIQEDECQDSWPKKSKNDEDVVDLVPVEDSAVTAKQEKNSKNKYSKKTTNYAAIFQKNKLKLYL